MITAFALLLTSTIMYYYLHVKTRISLKFLFIDNLLVAILSLGTFYAIKLINIPELVSIAISIIFVPIYGFILTMLRFYRTPSRSSSNDEDVIISPADGNVIYIKALSEDQMPISIKGKTISKIDEIFKTDILSTPCVLIGINLTPFDVHKNSAPISGKIVLQKHTSGKFLSLKAGESMTDNERNTFVIDNGKIKVGIVQIASKLVKRILIYRKENEIVKRGDWLGMITFGSQVDVIVPASYSVSVKVADQIYAGESVLARPKRR